MDPELNLDNLIDKSLSAFVRNISSLNSSLPLLMIFLSAATEKNVKEAEKFIKDNKISREKNKKGTFIKISNKNVLKYEAIQKKLDDTGLTLLILPKSFVISLIAQFDVLIGSLMKAMFLAKPQLLKIEDDKLSYQKIFELPSIEDIREHIISNKIDSALRAGHQDLIKKLEQHLNISFVDKLPNWNGFIEVCERRNLFVHTNGRVSDQYLKICRTVGVDISKLKKGQDLHISPDYFVSASNAVLEVGVLISLVLRTKIQPKNSEPAFFKINEICYQLINDGNYKLVRSLISFSLEYMGDKFNKEFRIILQINNILTHMLEENKPKVHEEVEKIDWSALHPRYKLAQQVLLGKHKEAKETMIAIGKKDDFLTAAEYEGWPLFINFRRSKYFRDGYKKVFRKEFIEVKYPKTLLEEIVASTEKYKNPKKKVLKI